MSNDGGPAFPLISELRQWYEQGEKVGYYHDGDPGMTLRDYFAGEAMHSPAPVVPTTCGGEPDLDAMAQWNYAYADAMIRARQPKPDTTENAE